ncbi:Pentatricopeptide repeat [Dillenia turbinata]|uniref:Pentatricopeptide repeat n=1 Tax=Dillenia turbinata TaxID=194707 RepID=A0AAN8VYX6_9MAGN
MQACGQLKNLSFGMDVHKYVTENGIEMDVLLFTSKIGFYAKCGDLDSARIHFGKSERDEDTYDAIISGYMIHGYNNRHDETPEQLCEMQAFGLRSNSVTFSSIVPAFSFFLNLKSGKEIHAYVIRDSYNPNIYVLTAIVDIYAKLRSVIIWTAVISAYSAHGDANMASAFFYEMLDYVTQLDPPAAEHFACMAGVLSQTERLSEVSEFISEMPIETNAKVWEALLNGASVYEKHRQRSGDALLVQDYFFCSLWEFPIVEKLVSIILDR